MKLEKEEILLTYQVLNQIQFKVGQSEVMLTVESIIKKLEQEAAELNIDLQLSKEKES